MDQGLQVVGHYTGGSAGIRLKVRGAARRPIVVRGLLKAQTLKFRIGRNERRMFQIPHAVSIKLTNGHPSGTSSRLTSPLPGCNNPFITSTMQRREVCSDVRATLDINSIPRPLSKHGGCHRHHRPPRGRRNRPQPHSSTSGAHTSTSTSPTSLSMLQEPLTQRG